MNERLSQASVLTEGFEGFGNETRDLQVDTGEPENTFESIVRNLVPQRYRS